MDLFQHGAEERLHRPMSQESTPILGEHRQYPGFLVHTEAHEPTEK